MTDYMHPGYHKPYPIQTVLRDLASQEGCDGEPYDAMVFAAARIDALEAKVARLEGSLSDPVAVHANLLRGTIAKPTAEQIIHLYGADALRAALTEGDTTNE
jgi:hypothetical protein